MICDPDLMFSSRIEAAASKAGLRAIVTTNVQELLVELSKSTPRIVFLNLDATEGKLGRLMGYIGSGFRIVGYYSHVNNRLQEEAKRVGLGQVISRGAFVGKLSEMLGELGSD